MNLLKTISMKLTVNLVNMFFHVDEDGAAFPLYTDAVKFIAHKCDIPTLMVLHIPDVSKLSSNPLYISIWPCFKEPQRHAGQQLGCQQSRPPASHNIGVLLSMGMRDIQTLSVSSI
jgi:hypothetical protein